MGVFVVLGLIAKSSENSAAQTKKKAVEDEIGVRKSRAEEARSAILSSGDTEMILKLRLMEAGFQAPIARSVEGDSRPAAVGPSAFGTAAAVAGGMVVGNAISGAIASQQLEAAFADIQADLEADLSEVSDSVADEVADLDGSDFDFEI